MLREIHASSNGARNLADPACRSEGMTKPATAQPRVFRHSGFGFHPSLVIQFLLALLLAGCAHYPVNAPLTHATPETGYRFTNLSHTNNSDSLFVVLAFSGCGTRAAALSYGVLEELAKTQIVWEGKRGRLLDEVDR